MGLGRVQKSSLVKIQIVSLLLLVNYKVLVEVNID